MRRVRAQIHHDLVDLRPLSIWGVQGSNGPIVYVTGGEYSLTRYNGADDEWIEAILLGTAPILSMHGTSSGDFFITDNTGQIFLADDDDVN